MAAIIFNKASGLNDTIYGKAEAPVKAFLEDTVKTYEEQSGIAKIFKMVTSDNFGEKWSGLTSMAHGFQPVGEGAAFPGDERQEGYSKFMEHTTWKDKFELTEEMMEDAKVIDVNKIGARGFVDQYYLTREKYGAKLLEGAIAGTSTTFRGLTMDCTAADGKSIFATDHPSVTGNTGDQSNKYSNVFSEDALGLIETAMQNRTDDNGEILNISPDTIVIPNIAALKKAVFAAIGADKDPATANNAFNYQFGRWTVVVNPYLNGAYAGDNTPYFVIDKKWNDSYNGLIYMDRIPLTIKSWVDNNTGNNIWNGRSRFVCGANDWRSISVGGIDGATTLT